MTTIERSILIPAPAAIVWATLTDTDRYRSWNPFIPEFSGELRPGAKVRLRISPPGGRAMSFAPTVTTVEADRLLEWVGHLDVPGLFDGRHSFTLDAIDADNTRLSQAERFTGCLVPLTPGLLRRTAAGIEGMNEAMASEAVARFGAATRSTRPAASPCASTVGCTTSASAEPSPEPTSCCSSRTCTSASSTPPPANSSAT